MKHRSLECARLAQSNSSRKEHHGSLGVILIHTAPGAITHRTLLILADLFGIKRIKRREAFGTQERSVPAEGWSASTRKQLAGILGDRSEPPGISGTRTGLRGSA